MYLLAQYHIWGGADHAYFTPNDFVRTWVYDRDPGTAWTWFDAIGFDIGKPTIGGVKLDGTIGADAWGESCATSRKAYEMWRDPDSPKERLYARRYDRAYTVMRMRPSYQNEFAAGTAKRAFSMPFSFRLLRADGTLSAATNVVELARAEGAILVIADPTNPPPSAPGGLKLNVK